MLTLSEDRVQVADGIRLYVREHRPARSGDDARDFLLVHGLSSNALLWDGVAAALAASGHRSVAVDLRSHGRSEVSDDLTHERLIDDLVAAIEQVGLDRPVAVGQSWGGNVVVDLAASRPAAVDGVVAVDGGLITLSDLFPDVESCWTALAPPHLDGLRWVDLEAGVVARTVGWPDGAAEAQLGNLARTPDGGVRAILTRERHRTIVEQLYAHRPLEQLSAMEVPMLLLAVAGRATGVVREKDIDLASTVAGDRFCAVRLPGRDHDVHLQEPATVSTLILDWIAGRTLPEVV